MLAGQKDWYKNTSPTGTGAYLYLTVMDSNVGPRPDSGLYKLFFDPSHSPGKVFLLILVPLPIPIKFDFWSRSQSRTSLVIT